MKKIKFFQLGECFSLMEGRYKYRSGMPKHEKPPMSILVRLPLDFQDGTGSLDIGVFLAWACQTFTYSGLVPKVSEAWGQCYDHDFGRKNQTKTNLLLLYLLSLYGSLRKQNLRSISVRGQFMTG
jgi:hypothetical protein